MPKTVQCYEGHKLAFDIIMMNNDKDGSQIKLLQSNAMKVTSNVHNYQHYKKENIHLPCHKQLHLDHWRQDP